MRRSVSSIICMLLLCGSAAAIYQDQAGKYDWLKQHVGVIKHVEVSGAAQPCIYVASTAGVLAALSPEDGSLLWRKVLDEDATIDALAAGSGVLVALSSQRHVRAFGGGGRLLWEASLPPARGAAASRADIAIVPGGKGSTMVAVRDGRAVAFALKSGRQVWAADLGLTDQEAAAVQRTAGPGEVLVAFLQHGATAVTSARLSAADGSVLERGTAASLSPLDPASLTVAPGGVVALSADGSRLCAGAAASGAPLECHASGAGAGAGASLRRGTCDAHVAVQSAGGGAALFKVGGASLTPAAAAARAATSGCTAAVDGSPLAAFAAAGAAGVEVWWTPADGGPEVARLADGGLRRQAVGGATLGVVSVFDVSVGGERRALVQLEEGTLALLRAPGGAAWVRREALAEVVDLMFADLPAPSPAHEAAWAAAQPSRSEALRAQLLSLKAQVGLALPPEEAALAAYAAATSARLRPTRDPDGFRRQLLVATAAGKVAALHTGDGRVLWEVDFGAGAAPARLAPWRAPHDVAQDEEVVALRAGAGGGVAAAVINTRTGEVVLREEEVPAAPQGGGGAQAGAAQVLPLPLPLHAGRAAQSVYVVAPAAPGAPATVLPRTPEARAAFAAQAAALTYWRVDAGGGAVEGHGFAADGSRRLLWRVDAAPPGSGLRVLAAAAREPGEAVYAAARPVAGGAIKLKHLSPNTVLVVAGVGGGRAPPRGGGRLVVTLLDAASGRVLFSQTHQAASGPVHAVVTENSAVYHYWSARHERWAVSSIDVYKEPPPGLTVADLALGRGAAAGGNASAWDAHPLLFDRASFLSKLPAAALGATRTAHGTAAKMLLLATPAGQVYMLDRRLVDPRRPVLAPGAKPTPTQMAEGLPPYAPELAVAGPAFATMDRRVARLRRVLAAPAVLESASLMAAVGLDLFYARLQPSRGFDMVPDDFPHALLVAIVAGMAAAAVAMRAIVQKRALKLKWQ